MNVNRKLILFCVELNTFRLGAKRRAKGYVHLLPGNVLEEGGVGRVVAYGAGGEFGEASADGWGVFGEA
jgi:hypothetical protein